MQQKLSGIAVCIWDFDGTLFPPNAAITRDIMEADYQVVMHHNGWTREKTVAEFGKVFQIVTPSSTETAAILSHIPVAEAAIECEQYKDRTKYLKRDEKLIELFRRLSPYAHYILANGIREKVVTSLKVLGLPPETFAEIVTSEIVGMNKPNPKGFVYIMQKSGLPPGAHLMIGDREAVDLVPAKSLGMKTCLAWSTVKSTVADITLPTVYELTKFLG